MSLTMRKDPLITGKYYHIYNRGVDKRDIFMDKRNLERFVLSVKLFNSVKSMGSIQSMKLGEGGISQLSNSDNFKKMQPLVSIACYCFNPNHFHFIVKQEVDGGISEFFKRLLGGYTKYFNDIHKRSGALFQGRFKSNLIDNDDYFLKIRPYVNKNYLIHDIPIAKNHLIWASDKEYHSGEFDIVSKNEAEELLNFYEGKENFEKESLNTISIIRDQRGKTSLLEEDLLP